MRILKLAKTLALLAMFALVASPANAYDLRDARYVSSSKNIDVLYYIVCLQEKNSLQPRKLSVPAALNKAVAACQKEKASLPKDPNEPSAADIKLSILECGFEKSEASPDMDCGDSSSAKKPTKTTTKTKAPSRPGRPAVTDKRPTKVVRATPRRRTTTKPTRPSQPVKTTSTRSGFPIIAESRGSNIRSLPQANGKKLGSSKSGQPVTLLANVGKNYKGYPWFKIRMSNGTVGYQWGGGLCAKARTLVSGTKGTCKVQVAKRKQPTLDRTTSSKNKPTQKKNDAADVIVSVLDLVGKIIENGNNKNTKADAAIFSQNLNVSADGPYVLASREVVKDKEAALYTVQGKKGQVLNVDVWSPKGNVVFEIYEGQATAGGRTLRGASQDDNTQSFRDKLPRNGKYQILVGSVNGTEKFELSVALDSAVSAPVPTTGPIYSGGTVALNRRVVGTYSSKTATSGNLQLNEVANALTWTTFCGPTIALSVDWTNNLLLPNSGIGALELKMSRKGKVRSFTYNGHKYTKQAGISMPTCARPNTASATKNGKPSKGAPAKPAPVAVIHWEDNPKDSRANRNYDKVHMAWWGICERENYDQNSLSFNNEKAYWDCADAGQLDGGGTLTAPAAAKAGSRPVDPRETKDYSAVSNPAQDACSIKFPTSLPNDKGYYDCMDVALNVAFTARPTKPTVPRQTPDPRLNKDYSKVSNAAVASCDAANPNIPADDKGFFDCMDAAPKTGSSTPVTKPTAPKPVAPDPRVNKDYSKVSNIAVSQCQAANPNSPADDKGYFDCMDVALKAGSSAPTTKPTAPKSVAPDPRVNKDYSKVSNIAVSQCQAANPNSPADDKGYFDCMDVALKAGSSAPTTKPIAPKPVAPDPRANNDYSRVPQAAASLCEAANPNSPSDDKGFFDCMDVADMNALEELEDAAGADQDNGGVSQAVPDPRSSKEYATVTGDEWNACWAQEATGGLSVVYDCLDAYEAAASNASGTTAPENDNQSVGNDALAEIQSYCEGNDQCYVDLENCYYQHGSLESPEFEQCAAAWDQDDVQTQDSGNQQSQDTQPANDNQSVGNDDPLAEIQSYCEGNDQCFAELESCYYQHGSLESPEFEQCGAAWQ